MIALVAAVVHAKDAVVARAGELRDLLLVPHTDAGAQAAVSKAREVCDAVDKMREAKTAAGL